MASLRRAESSAVLSLLCVGLTCSAWAQNSHPSPAGSNNPRLGSYVTQEPQYIPLQPGQTVRIGRDGVTKFAETTVIQKNGASAASRIKASNRLSDMDTQRRGGNPPVLQSYAIQPYPSYGMPWGAPWYAYGSNYCLATIDPYYAMRGAFDAGENAGRRETLFKGALDMYNERVGNAPYDANHPYAGAVEAAPYPYALDPSYQSGYRTGEYLAEQWLARDRNLLKTARISLQNGTALFRAGRYQEALDAYRLAGSSNHGDAAARLLAGHTYFALGRYHSAMAFIRRAFELQPKISQIEYDLRDDYGNKADFTQHLEALKQAASTRPKDVEIWTLMGYVHRYSGNRAESISALKQAYKIAPKDRLIQSMLDLTPDPSK